VIVEWGFAMKHAAVWPSTLKGAYWRAFYEVEITRRLDRSAFAPPPSVDAAVLRFTRSAEPLVPHSESRRYWQFLSEAFHAGTELRRCVLSPLEVKRLAPILGFAPTARPRELDARQWAGVYALSAGRGSRSA
jgi:23S rRNA (adenine-N6)-dimethyltransferase